MARKPVSIAVPSRAHKEPGAAETARARHRRVQLPCDTDLTAALLALVGDIMRDTRHRQARAWADVNDWLTWLELSGKALRTLYNYERQVALLLRLYLDYYLADFTAAEINKTLTMVPPRSRYITRSVFNQLFEWAANKAEPARIDRNPMARGVPSMKQGKRRSKEIFSEADVALLEDLPLPDGPLWSILFYTGLRRAEARHLKWGHINLGRMRLTVHSGKGDKDRPIPFPPEVAAALADLELFERLQPDDHLWYRARYKVGDRRRRTDPIGSTTFHTWYVDGLTAAGVTYTLADGTNRNPHQTRHTYAQWLRDQRFELDERAELLGHDSPVTTVRQYGRNNIEDIASKMALL